MKFILENGRWYVEFEGEKVFFEKFIANLMNKNLPSPAYVVGTEMDDRSLYTPLAFYDDLRYPDGAMKSPFQIYVLSSDDQNDTIRIINISNSALANELKSSLAELGFKNVLLAPSRETVQKIAKHFGE